MRSKHVSEVENVRVDLASPTAGQPLICALIGGAQPINGCGPLSHSAILKERVGAKGTITKVHVAPLNPPTDLARSDLGGAASDGKHHATFAAVHDLAAP